MIMSLSKKGNAALHMIYLYERLQNWKIQNPNIKHAMKKIIKAAISTPKPRQQYAIVT